MSFGALDNQIKNLSQSEKLNILIDIAIGIEVNIIFYSSICIIENL
jgi:hypothetical protein